MANAQKRRVLDKDLPLEERKRKLAPILDSVDPNLGLQEEAIRKDYLASLPPEEQGKWHVTWDLDKPDPIALKQIQGYEKCKKGGKQVQFKDTILWRIPDELYQKRLLRGSAQSIEASNEWLKDKLVDEDNPNAEG